MNYRNFCIIAHIDHGKSTLADRLLELTGTIQKRDKKHEQILDTMDLEQERGITIKLQPVKMLWKGIELNLIDTPGHVDFSYEVSRSLAACEGALLVVDATQGIEAQTLANLYMAIDQKLRVIPVINKIDLPNAEPDRRADEICDMVGFDRSEVQFVSAKTGEGVQKLLDAIIQYMPSAPIQGEKPFRALIFDSQYDTYRGIVAYTRIIDGEVHKGDKIRLFGTQFDTEVLELGYFSPQLMPKEKLTSGDIGYIVTSAKDLNSVRVGDTVMRIQNARKESLSVEGVKPLEGYKRAEPFVFAGIFCTDAGDYPELRTALEKLKLNDAALQFEPESSEALGFGFRCGFLGLLHMEIVQARLEREFSLNLIFTAPNVSYRITRTSKEIEFLSNPADLPDRNYLLEIAEPWVKLEVVVPHDLVGNVMKLCDGRRGILKNMTYIETTRALLHYEMPLANIITSFYDRLKSVSSGYASFVYEFIDYRNEDLVKMDVLINTEVVAPLAAIVLRRDAHSVGVKLLAVLKEAIPRHMFQVSLQCAIGGKVVARENISAMRKNVTAKLYGGDVSRKLKLLKKQAEGKKRMKMFGRVEVPQEAFLSALKLQD